MLALRKSALATVALLALGGCGDAFTSADASDASTGTSEGGSSGDGGAGSFCAMQSAHHLFCDDFDDRSGTGSTIVQGAWSPGETQSAAASATIDGLGVATPSPPNSFLAQTTAAIPVEIETLALLTEGVGRLGQTQRLQTSVDVLVSSYGGNGTIDQSAVVLAIAIGPLSYDLALADATHAYFSESGGGADGGASATRPLSSAFGTGTWTNVTVLLDAPTATTAGHVKITLTATGQTAITALDVDLTEMAAVAMASASVSLGVGLKLAASKWAVRFDNVLFDTL